MSLSFILPARPATWGVAGRRIVAGLALGLALLAVSAPVAGLAAAERPDIGGPFELASSRGGTVSDRDLQGHPFAVFFGFTHCPEVCPTALAELSLVLEDLGSAAADLRVFFVTVDPQRDTPAHLADYLGSFDERIVGLHGTPGQTAEIARAYKATYRKVPLADGDYTMDHTALVFLMDRQGRFFDKLDYRADQTTQIAAFRRLLASP